MLAVSGDPQGMLPSRPAGPLLMLRQDLLAAQRVGLTPSLPLRCDRAVGIEPRMLQLQLQRPHALANDLLAGPTTRGRVAVLGPSSACQRETSVPTWNGRGSGSAYLEGGAPALLPQALLDGGRDGERHVGG